MRRVLFLALAVLILALGAFLVTRPAPSDSPLAEVYFFDFVDADAILIRQGNRAALIDAGEEKHGPQLVEYLQQLGIRKLDFLLLTHPDKDHIGGASAVLDAIPADTIYQSAYQKDGDAFRDWTEYLEENGLRAGTPTSALDIEWEGLTFTLYPAFAAGWESANDASIVTALHHGDVRMVFAGDARAARIEELEALPIFPCTLLKVPHHGRYSAGGPELIARLSPAFAVVTASHADKSIEAALEKAGAKTYYTVDSICATSDGHHVEVAIF